MTTQGAGDYHSAIHMLHLKLCSKYHHPSYQISRDPNITNIWPWTPNHDTFDYLRPRPPVVSIRLASLALEAKIIKCIMIWSPRPNITNIWISWNLVHPALPCFCCCQSHWKPVLGQPPTSMEVTTKQDEKVHTASSLDLPGRWRSLILIWLGWRIRFDHYSTLPPPV